MSRFIKFFSMFFAMAAAAICCLGVVGQVHAQTANPFEEGAYLWSRAYDSDLNGSSGVGYGDWTAYKSWLGVTNLGVEVDPGTSNWYDCCQDLSWNSPWGTMQSRYGSTLPDVILGIGQMPSDPNGNDTWAQKLAWEDHQWQLEAADDPTTMAYFANYAQEIDNGAHGFSAFNSVIIRLGYEFDGGWDSYGNLNVMTNMPANYLAAWRNIVTTMRANDPKHIIKGFLWNPTDGNVQVTSFDYYPGDAYVDYIGFDEYDYVYNGDYPVGTTQPTQAMQTAAWNDVELPRINAFGNFSRTHNNKPIIVGEWGLWQLNDSYHPSGGDNPSYIQHMHDWMADPNNHVYMEVYFETPSDGDSQLWPGGNNPSWGSGTAYPNSAALYKTLFSESGGTSLDPILTGTNFNDGAGSWGGDNNNTADKAFDGDTGTFYDCANASGYTGIDLGANNTGTVTAIRYYARSGFANRMIGGVFEGSNNPTSGYVTLATVVTASDTSWTTVTVSGASAYRYLRYRDSGTGNCNVAEIEFHGTLSTGGSVPAPPDWNSLTPGTGSIFLSWIWPSGADTFDIYRGTTPGGEAATPIASGVGYSSWNDSGLTSGQTYYYTLKAVNSYGESAMSAEASATAQ